MFTQLPIQARYSYTVYNTDPNTGDFSHKEHLNWDELDFWMESKINHFARITVIRDQDNHTVTYDSFNNEWKVVNRNF